MKKLIFVAVTVAMTLSQTVLAQTRSTDDSTGVRPLVGSPVLPFTALPPIPQATSNNGTIPFSYSSYGSITNTINSGVATYWMSGTSVVVGIVGASGQSVNQSAPTLQDSAGQVYYPTSSNCSAAASTCGATFNVVAGRSPARLYVYSQGNYSND